MEAALEAGFNPDYSDSFGTWDCKFETIENRPFLLGDSLAQQGNSLFHIACQNGNKRIAKLVRVSAKKQSLAKLDSIYAEVLLDRN